MNGMAKLNRTPLWRVTRDRHRGSGRDWRGEFTGSMTGGAARLRWRLMVTDGASARALERKLSLSNPGLMTHEARQFLVPRVRKAVARWRRRRGRVQPEVKTRRNERRIECRTECITARQRSGRVEAG